MSVIEVSRMTFLRSWLLWTAGFLALLLGGYVGAVVTGRVDGPLAAPAGGATPSSAPRRPRGGPGRPPEHPSALDLGFGNAGALGFGMDRHHRFDDSGRPAIHRFGDSGATVIPVRTAGGTPLPEGRPVNAHSKKANSGNGFSRDLLTAHRAGRVQVAIGHASDFFGGCAQ